MGDAPMVQGRARLMARHTDVDSYIGALDPGLASLARGLRAVVVAAVPEAVESIKWSHPTYESGGPFCYIRAFSGYVNLGFWRGAALDDPTGVVRTTGRTMGHVRITTPAQIDTDVLGGLLRQAAALNARLGNPASTR